MFAYRSILLGVACCAALVASQAATAACEPKPGRRPIQVSVADDGTPQVSEDPVKACEGESLRWVFKGSETKEFSIIFVSADDSPFDWDRQTGNTVTGTVKTGAARANPYKYDVDVDGKRLDPRIIVEP